MDAVFAASLLGYSGRDFARLHGRVSFISELALLAERQPAGSWERDVLAKWPEPVPRPEPVVMGTGSEPVVTGGEKEVEAGGSAGGESTAVPSTGCKCEAVAPDTAGCQNGPPYDPA